MSGQPLDRVRPTALGAPGEIDDPASRRGRVYAQQLSEASLQAAADWVVQVEEVAGVAQPTHIETPVLFCAAMGKAPGDCPGLEPRAPGQPRRAADPRVRLAQLQASPAGPDA